MAAFQLAFLSIAGERSHTSPVSLSSTASSVGVPVPASKTAKRGLGDQSCQSASVMSHSGRINGLRYMNVGAKAHRRLYLVSWQTPRDFRPNIPGRYTSIFYIYRNKMSKCGVRQ